MPRSGLAGYAWFWCSPVLTTFLSQIRCVSRGWAPTPCSFADSAHLAKSVHFLTLKDHMVTPGLATSTAQKGRSDASGFQGATPDPGCLMSLGLGQKRSLQQHRLPVRCALGTWSQPACLSYLPSILTRRAPETGHARAVAMVTLRAVQSGSGASDRKRRLKAERVPAAAQLQPVAFAELSPTLGLLLAQSSQQPPRVCTHAQHLKQEAPQSGCFPTEEGWEDLM